MKSFSDGKKRKGKGKRCYDYFTINSRAVSGVLQGC